MSDDTASADGAMTDTELAEGETVCYCLAPGDPGYYPGGTAPATVLHVHRNGNGRGDAADLEVDHPARKFHVTSALLAGPGRCPAGTPRSFSR